MGKACSIPNCREPMLEYATMPCGSLLCRKHAAPSTGLDFRPIIHCAHCNKDYTIGNPVSPHHSPSRQLVPQVQV